MSTRMTAAGSETVVTAGLPPAPVPAGVDTRTSGTGIPVGARIRLLGGLATGAESLFATLAACTCLPGRSNALSYLLGRRAGRVVEPATPDEPARSLRALHEALRGQGESPAGEWATYRLEYTYASGFLGRRKSVLTLEYDPRAGEVLAPGDAKVLIICLPAWACLPVADLPSADEDQRLFLLDDFERTLVRNRPKAAASIVALTEADDPRFALAEVRERWIEPYRAHAPGGTNLLESESALADYLDDASRISEYIRRQLGLRFDARAGRILSLLDADGRKPWFVPLAAAAESTVEEAPVHAHAELPLLIAFSIATNALM